MKHRFTSFAKSVTLFTVTLLSSFAVSAQQNYTIGTGTSGNGQYDYPTPFGDWYEGSRAQYLFRASELIAAGMGPGNISAISWNVTALNGMGILENYEIKIGTTTANSLSTSSWEPGINTQVFGPVNYQPTSGINKFTLPVPFLWNGVDNIIVEVCSGDPSNTSGTSQYTYNASVNWTTNLGFTAAHTYRADNGGNLCGTGSTSNTGDPQTRPNTIFEWLPVLCDGAPDPGTAITGETLTCVGYPLVMFDTTHTRNSDTLVGISWTWETSLDSFAWQEVPGSAFQDSLITTVSNAAFYRMRVICTETLDTTYSNVISIKIAPPYACYCYSMAIGADEDTSDIGGVKFGPLEINEGGSHTLNPIATRGRTNRANIGNILLYQDSTYTFRWYHTMPSDIHKDAKITVFMDFNNNLQYDIPEERVYTGYTSVTNFVLIDSIYIPKQVVLGVPTGMRIILNNDTGPNAPSDSACGPYMSGETEDYVIQFSVNFPTSVSSVSSAAGFDIFPNPNNGKFTVSYNSNKAVDRLNVSVTDITGKQIFVKEYQNAGKRFSEQIDMGSVSGGMYIITVQADNERFIQRMTIK